MGFELTHLHTTPVRSMFRKFIAASAFILATAPLIPISAIAASAPKVTVLKQGSHVANKSICQKTVSAVRSQLRLVKSVQMRQIGAQAGKYPQGRSMVASFTIVNNHPRSAELINASAKLSAASKKIAANCTNVGMIEFYIDQTDHGVVYGVINGQINQFTCNNETPIKWGEIMCP